MHASPATADALSQRAVPVVASPAGTPDAASSSHTPRRVLLAPLTLPSAAAAPGKAWSNELRLSAEMLDTLVACNRDHERTLTFPSGDIRRRFLGSLVNKPPLAIFVRKLGALCPRTWPAVMYTVDRASRYCGIPIVAGTVYRLLTAATYLVLSCEGEEEYRELATIHSTPLSRVEQLGGFLEELLREVQEGAEGETWDDFVGLKHVGWMRAELPRHARQLQREHARHAARGGDAAAVREPLVMNFNFRVDTESQQQRCQSLCLRAGSLSPPNRRISFGGALPSRSRSLVLSMRSSHAYPLLSDLPCASSVVSSPATCDSSDWGAPASFASSRAQSQTSPPLRNHPTPAAAAGNAPCTKQVELGLNADGASPHDPRCSPPSVPVPLPRALKQVQAARAYALGTAA